ncbi:hypothetical protein CspHIS471_0603870 [Cutaneotrichosporon sp. HIS471]|nr:hypothetical protein CspHIS471_0603870 [Cutaneotrichosporon sp. HIS471]
MTSNKQIVSQVAIAYGVLLFLGSRNQIGRTVWVLLNLRDTLRALKDMYPNGRRIGVVTRRRRLRAALAGWIVLVAVQPMTFLADTLLSWIPFYSSIKMLLVLALSFWRLESSPFLFQILVVPVVRRYETHIDLTLLLLGSTALLFFHFLVELPWSAMVALAKYPSRRVLRVSAYEAPAPSVATSSATTPSRPTRPASTSTGRPSSVETQEGSKLKSFRPTSPHRPRGPRNPEHKAHHGPPTTTRKTAATVAKHGRVRAAAQALDVASAPSTANRESHRSTSTNGRGKASGSEAPALRAPSTRADATQHAKVMLPISKPAERRAMRPHDERVGESVGSTTPLIHTLKATENGDS